MTASALRGPIRWLVVAGLAAGALAWGPALGAGLVDDAYIFARYADNVLAGHGPVFNPGERVEGYTSPAHLALTAALAATGLEAPLAAQTAGLLALIGLVALLGAAGRSGLIAALLVAGFAPLSLWAWAGMDGPLFALAVAAAALAVDRCLRTPDGLPGRAAWLLVGSTVLVRPEGLAVVVAAWVAVAPRLLRQPAVAWRPLLALVPVAALTAARVAYYDAWLPNTFYAKVDEGGPTLWGRGLVYLGNAAVVTVPLLAGALLTLRRGVRWPGAAVWMALALAGGIVVTGGDHFPMVRFALPIVAVLALVAGRAIVHRPRPWLVGGALVAALAAMAWVAPAPFGDAEKGMRERFADEVAMARHWARTGTHLREVLGPDRTVALIAVGAIPYETGWRAIDMLGLTDRHIAREAAPRGGYAGHEKFDTDYVLDREPDLIVLLPTIWGAPVPEERVTSLVWGAANQDMLASPRFREEYALDWIPAGEGVIPVHRRSGAAKGAAER